MIDPRRTRLVRVPSLQAFRQAIARLSEDAPNDLFPATAVVVPTYGAAHQLRRVFTGVPPELVTRDGLYDSLHARLAAPPRRVELWEREVMLHAAALEAKASGAAPPFEIRPGLVAEMLRFYDQLRRQGQSVDRFEELLVESLDASDRGAQRLLDQTRFLAAAYRAYERRLGDRVDEHRLRSRLLTIPPADPLRHVIVAVADWIAEAHGLAAVDFDLLTRLPGLARIDVVSTEAVLRSGFHQRVHQWLPGIEEIDAGDSGVRPASAPVSVSRDREEELVAVARRVVRDPSDPDRVGVVFERPLPYLYLAREVFSGAGVPFQTIDSLPLAAEPVAAAFDLVIEFASSQFSRDASLALLRSPHLALTAEPVSYRVLDALDAAMRDARYLGELDALKALEHDDSHVAAALAALTAAALRLQPLLVRGSAALHADTLVDFFASHARDDGDARAKSGRARLDQVLRRLASAYRQHGDRDVVLDQLTPDIRRWIEEETVPYDVSIGGLHLLDATAARFGGFEHLTLVGLVDGEWPQRPRRNIFYAPSVLASLGWPSEQDRRSAATATFLDLVQSPSVSITLSTFTLDDEALVEPSPLIDEAATLGLSTIESTTCTERVFVDEALSLAPVNLDRLQPDARTWAETRLSRTGTDDPRYHGTAGPIPAREWSISGIETYLTCPFKFFAQRVLKLDEERHDEDVMDPKAQGQFVHEVFEAFFTSWQDRGHRNITPENLGVARELFVDVVEQQIAARRLSDAEASIERTRLLGSPVAAGLGETVFRMEAERPTPVVERLLEQRLKGSFDFTGPRGPRRIALNGVADRIDLLDDGTFRLIDYKLGSAPNRGRALQLPIYGLCTEQRLQGHRGRNWSLGEAAYVSFRGAQRVTPLFTRRSDRDEVIAGAQERLIDAVDAIERGEFPPTPTDVFLCGFCSFGPVCRKDYVGDV